MSDTPAAPNMPENLAIAPERAAIRISDNRIAPDNITVINQLGALGELAGTWIGEGFNLIARPNFHDSTDLFLQLNQTHETTVFTPIGSNIPNRGFLQEDINLYGLTYLQKITNANPLVNVALANQGALHIEPGIWVKLPGNIKHPDETTTPPKELVARMGTIPHGNSLLAQGIAEPFTGPPVLAVPGSPYNGSVFPSFNSTPFGVAPFPGGPPTVPPAPAPFAAFCAAGSSQKLTAAAIPLAVAFTEYELNVPSGAIPPGPLNPPLKLNTRTPYDTNPAEQPLPATINGVPMQSVINDPILLLQEVIKSQEREYDFTGFVINIATQTPITFLKNINTNPIPGAATTTVAVPQFSGGVENIPFLLGVSPQENAQTATVYATFWIEKLTHKITKQSFMQLQYAQMVQLDFPVFTVLHGIPSILVNLGWPHVSVATLKKSFN